MINFVPKAHPSVSLLFGKRPLQRVIAGASQQKIEIPLDLVADIPAKVDTSASYIGNKYNALPWSEFIDIKVDAANLIDSNMKTALTDLDFYPKVRALYCGHKEMTAADVLVSSAPKKLAYAIAK